MRKYFLYPHKTLLLWWQAANSFGFRAEAETNLNHLKTLQSLPRTKQNPWQISPLSEFITYLFFKFHTLKDMSWRLFICSLDLLSSTLELHLSIRLSPAISHVLSRTNLFHSQPPNNTTIIGCPVKWVYHSHPNRNSDQTLTTIIILPTWTSFQHISEAGEMEDTCLSMQVIREYHKIFWVQEWSLNTEPTISPECPPNY